MKHTQGKWIEEIEQSFPPSIDAVYIVSESDETICEIEDINEWKANAKLIAAAPELLEALRDLTKYCQENDTGAELEFALDAIKKATE